MIEFQLLVSIFFHSQPTTGNNSKKIFFLLLAFNIWCRLIAVLSLQCGTQHYSLGSYLLNKNPYFVISKNKKKKVSNSIHIPPPHKMQPKQFNINDIMGHFTPSIGKNMVSKIIQFCIDKKSQ